MLMPNEIGVVNITDFDSLQKSLQAESPDEVALIIAMARHCKILLTKKFHTQIESTGLKLLLPNGNENMVPSNAIDTVREVVELLAVNEFDSDRKMMSVLVRYKPTEGSSRTVLLCKGADSSMFQNCVSSLNPFTNKVYIQFLPHNLLTTCYFYFITVYEFCG